MLWSSVPNLITYKPASAQKIHRCEEYKRTDGEKSFRVVPNIPGSFGIPLYRAELTHNCYVPVTSRKYFIQQFSEGPWDPCVPEPNNGFTFDNWVTGNGQVLERYGKKYHVFSSGKKFYFD